MKGVLRYILICILFATVLFSCKQRERKPIITDPVTYEYQKDTTGDNNPEEMEIFYGLLTPVEVSAIFTRLGAAYDRDVLNPTESGDNYLSVSKAAINLGVYGVDLSYLKMFDLSNEMIRYMMVVRSLSDRLGIPSTYLTDPINEMKNDMSSSDSVLTLVNTAYTRIENHLKINSRESTAGLMVLGGWIEALYLSTELLLDCDDPDPEVVARIAEQKYTLNTLLSFLKNYYDDPVVVYYTKKLKFLKKYFDRFDIYFYKGDLEIDLKKQVLRASKREMTITKENMKDIKDYLKKMRMETIAL